MDVKLRRMAALAGVLALTNMSPANAQTASQRAPLIPGACSHTPAELQPITERGRYIEEYDQAAWHATDAALGSSPNPPSTIQMFIALKTGSRWSVYFGRLNEARTAFVPALLAVQDTAKPASFTMSPVSAADGVPLTPYALGIEAARDLFGSVSRPYNIALYPLPDRTFYVYMYPAQTKSSIYPIGGDERFHFSFNGKTLLERHRMHRTILDIDPAAVPPGMYRAADMHSDLFSDMPEDTDVFHVLAQFRTPTPGYVDAQGVLYLIDTTGAIVCKGTIKRD